MTKHTRRLLSGLLLALAAGACEYRPSVSEPPRTPTSATAPIGPTAPTGTTAPATEPPSGPMVATAATGPLAPPAVIPPAPADSPVVAKCKATIAVTGMT